MIFSGVEVNAATGAGLTVIVLLYVVVLLQASMNVHVSVTTPPHNPGAVVWVEVTQPEIKQPPEPLFE